MSPLVIDASAAVMLVRDEPGSDDVRRELRRCAADDQPILVPSLFWLEVVNALARRYRYPPEAIVEAVYELEQQDMTTVDLGRPTTLAVIDAVARSGLTAYDALYLVLTESAGGRLVTGDAALARAAGERAVLVRQGPRISEAPPTYEDDGAWPKWTGAAAYLAELRSGHRA